MELGVTTSTNPKFLRWWTEPVIKFLYFKPNYILKVLKSVLWVLHYRLDWISCWYETRVSPRSHATTLALRAFFSFSHFACLHSAQWATYSPSISTLNLLPLCFLYAVPHSLAIRFPFHHKTTTASCFLPFVTAIHLLPGLNPKDNRPDVISFYLMFSFGEQNGHRDFCPLLRGILHQWV